MTEDDRKKFNELEICDSQSHLERIISPTKHGRRSTASYSFERFLNLDKEKWWRG